MAIPGVSGKSVACLLLYRMGRTSFAVDANVLRIMTRLGWYALHHTPSPHHHSHPRRSSQPTDTSSVDRPCFELLRRVATCNRHRRHLHPSPLFRCRSCALPKCAGSSRSASKRVRRWRPQTGGACSGRACNQHRASCAAPRGQTRLYSAACAQERSGRAAGEVGQRRSRRGVSRPAAAQQCQPALTPSAHGSHRRMQSPCGSQVARSQSSETIRARLEASPQQAEPQATGWRARTAQVPQPCRVSATWPLAWGMEARGACARLEARGACARLADRVGRGVKHLQRLHG